MVIGIGAQSTLGGKTFLRKKMYEKLTKCSNFTWFMRCPKNFQNTGIFFMIFAQKINKIPYFYMIFVQKMPKFCTIIARKIFFPNFGVRGPCPRLVHICPWANANYIGLYPALILIT